MTTYMKFARGNVSELYLPSTEPIVDELPPLVNGKYVVVSTAAELSSALAGTSSLGALQPGDQVVIKDGDYRGSFSLSRDGIAPTNSNRNGSPIILRAENVMGPTFYGKLNLSGTNGWAHGLDFDGENNDKTIGGTYTGHHSRLMRCRFRRYRTITNNDSGGEMCRFRGKYQKAWFCEWDNFEGRCINSKSTTSEIATYLHIANCFFHDNVPPPSGSSGNARELIQLGETQTPNGVPCNNSLFGLVEYCRAENCYTTGSGDHDENEPISVKSCDNIIDFFTFGLGMGSHVKINIRFGNRNKVRSCRIRSGHGISLHGDDNVIIKNWLTSGGINVLSGNQWMDPYLTGDNANLEMTGGEAPWNQHGDFPSARRSKIISNTGTLSVGVIVGSVAGKPVVITKDNEIFDHSGSINTQNDYSFSSPNSNLREVRTSYTSSPAGEETAEDAREILESEVGVFGTWVQPRLWPPTL